MNSNDTITTLFSHHRWANLRLLECCAALTDDQLKTTVLGAYGSIHDTLQHIVTAEQSYLHRLRTGQPRPDSDVKPTLSIAELVELARETGTGLIEIAPMVPANAIVQVNWKDGTRREVPKTIFLTQVINHSTEHRAQVMAILTQLGVEPPDLQAWQYFDELDQ